MRSALILVSLWLAACAPVEHSVAYKVTGDPDWPKTDSPRAHITIENENGGSEQHDVETPFSQQLAVRSGAFVYVSAQAQAGMEITCEIYEDGKLIKRSESDGEFAVATCSAVA